MRRFVPTLTLAALALASTVAVAGDYRVGGVEVRSPWTRPAQAGMNGVGYLTLANVGTKPIKLAAVESPAAQSVGLHESKMTGGVMSMRPVTGGLTVAPGGKVDFAPGGYHLMLLGLKTTQSVGGKVPLTLVFADGRRMKIELSVEAGPPKASGASTDPMAGMHDHH
ncbi:MAG: copper chaperone PCu(A)C [Caulobacter sp.]|nr:copper chaperone PCu(A)C [Caulobacter sp.]